MLQKRFVLDMESVPPRIRAAQGHSVHLEEPVFNPVSSSEEVSFAIHVTSKEG
jgi:2'-phosphotransferase